MSNRRLRFRVWCEDREHEAFARAILEKLYRATRRDVDVIPAPSGRGAASTWVARQYGGEVLPQSRRARKQAGLGFVVLIDGDNLGFLKRVSLLEELGGPREPMDRIALLVPTWSIETWVLWLSGESVTEDRPSKDSVPPDRFRQLLPAAISAWEIERPDERTSVPSLAAARVEMNRFPG